MARSINTPQIWLGYEDEYINEKHKGQVNFTTNKIGGKPDFPSDIKIDLPLCPLCQIPKPLVVQIYAPLENSSYHRMLYLFACINPNCWNHSESWTCLRSQTLEQIMDSTEQAVTVTSNVSVTNWCVDADDWDDNNSNINEENGNLINIEKVSDEDDESFSFEECIRAGLGNLSIDDKNANTGLAAEAQGGGAVGHLHSPAATAEIEGEEGEVISIDTPTGPQHDIAALLHEVMPVPQDIYQNDQLSDLKRTSNLYFIPLFMSVWEETYNTPNMNDCHVRELLQEYQQRNKLELNTPNTDGSGDSGAASIEKYEKSNPAHGDKMFHNFMSKIQMNPGQILRYSRDGAPPLLLYPLQETPRRCQYCHGDMVFEFQVLPTIIPKLKLVMDKKVGARLEFGTALIYTCKRSCWSTDSVVQNEAVIVQTEFV